MNRNEHSMKAKGILILFMAVCCVLFAGNVFAANALVAGLSLNIMNQHCDRVKMANIAQTINVLQAMVLTKDEKMLLTPTYHVFEMFKEHQDATLLPSYLQCDDYRFEREESPAHNTFEQTERVKPETSNAFKITDEGVEATPPSKSVDVFEIQ